MPDLYVARRDTRKGLFLPMNQSGGNPSLLFPLTKNLERSELDELIRAQLDRVGITKESDVQSIIDKAEEDYELRVKIDEARKEVRRLMKLRAEGKKLMQIGNKKWKEVYYPKK